MESRTIVEDGVVRTLCRQCDMRCGLNVHIEAGRIVKLTGFKPHRQSHGRICAKGAAAVDLVYHPDRLLKPLKKQTDGTFTEIPYDRAMDEIAERIQGLKEKYGPRSFGVWTGEAIGFFQQEEYARRFIHAFGSPNYFSAESLCYASRYIACCLVQGYHTPCPDFSNSNVIVLWGSNLGLTHPPYMRSIEHALEKGARLIVIDPRRTAAARRADLFVQPYPGTDAALAWGTARHLIESGHYDRGFVENHTVGFDKFSAYAKKFTPDYVARQTGLSAERVEEIGRMIGEGRPRVAVYPGISLEHQTNGLNTVRSIVCLSGLCGAVDAAGGDIRPIPFDHRSLTLYEELPLSDREPIGADRFPVLYQYRRQCHSMTAMDYILGDGRYPLRGMIVTGANPVLSNPNARKTAGALASLDLLVVRDLFLTESAGQAHYVLPAATFLERSELHYHLHHQMVTLTTKVLDVPGVTDEYTFWRDLAHRLGLGEQYFPWKNEDEVNEYILGSTAISLETLKKHPEGYVYAPIELKKYRTQPFPTKTGKFQFTSDYLKKLGYMETPEYVPPSHRPGRNGEYPFVLITGARYRRYYHSRYRNIERLSKAVPRAELEIHPADAARLGIGDKERVKVISPIGTIEIETKIVNGNDILPGVVQIGHGWDDPNVNILTDDHDLDPISGYPNMKLAPVDIKKIS